MGRPFVEFVSTEDAPKYICKKCRCDIAADSDKVWEGFMNTNAPAILLKCAVNIERISSPRQEELSTGIHQLVDVACRFCQDVCGWQYLWAEKQGMKYKEGTLLVQLDMLKLQPANSQRRVETAGGDLDRQHPVDL